MNLFSQPIPVAKRLCDLLALLILAPVLLPVGFLISIAVFLDSPGSVIYRASRIGMGGRAFEMLKFRTMRIGMDGSSIAAAEDERITSVGRFLRATRLDEIPQLWNVLCGQMSFVGPRPELKEFVDMHAEDYRKILTVAPGITGPTQLRFAGVEARLLDMQEDPDAFYKESLLPDKVALDLAYARSHSNRSDFAVIARTVGLPLILAWQRLQGKPSAASSRPVAYAAFAMAAAALPLVFALGLGSPR